MTISIYFQPGEPVFYESFIEIISLEKYDSIKYIICRHCNLLNLPPLPRMLVGLFCEDNYLTELPELPFRLKELRCCKNQLESLPKLPYHLEELYCSYNNLKELPDLVFNDYDKFGILTGNENKYEEGGSIRKLWCENNKITTLPKLPFTLHILNCSNNCLTEFPELPQNINSLDISYNKLKKIPVNLIHLWYLMYIDYSNNDVSTSIPWFADELDVLKCSNNPLGYVNYVLPDKLSVFQCLNTNLKTIPNLPKYLRSLDCNKELFENIQKKFHEFDFKLAEDSEDDENVNENV